MRLVNTYLKLPDIFYQKVMPSKVNSPKMVIFNHLLAKSLKLSKDAILNPIDWCSGNQLLENSVPIAQAYAGHQFGHFNILGDGRAILLGELKTDDGDLIDIQLKGSGRTPYSRRGDGKATLASMLREYVISEAMYALNIPTTRSLAVIATGEQVIRHMVENGAVLTRLSSSHLRVGTFVYAQHMTDAQSGIAGIRQLMDYGINRHYPDILDKKFNHKSLIHQILINESIESKAESSVFIDEYESLLNTSKALALLDKVMDSQALLVAHWTRVGFIHGVMNTDNVTISGETIDYGPCAFMDVYHEDTVYSSIDKQGRYAFNKQMTIMWWNMARFAESLLPIIVDDVVNDTKANNTDTNKSNDENNADKINEKKAVEITTKIINTFGQKYQKNWSKMLCAKIGLDASEFNFANELLQIMQQSKLDYTNTFCCLTSMLIDDNFDVTKYPKLLRGSTIDNHLLSNWISCWQQKLDCVAGNTVDTENKLLSKYDSSLVLMKNNNPVVIPRNHLVEEALVNATNDNLTDFNDLLTVLGSPYDWDKFTSDINDTEIKSGDVLPLDVKVDDHFAKFIQPASDEWNKEYRTYCGT